MATIKSYTDIEQSKKLAKILPTDSADMCYRYYSGGMITGYGDCVLAKSFITRKNVIRENDLPCWSLAALLDALRTFTTPTAFSVKVSAPSLIKTENGYKLTYTGDYTPMINNELNVEAPIESIADSPIDACVAMIEKLNELKML